MNLIEILKNLKGKTQIHNFDEAVTKQTIILPILQLLGWSIFDSDEVCPEFFVENRRVDYCLRINYQNEFFIEVKRTGEDLERHQEQLLEYAFRQGVELASLTNGITWHFYLPMKKGDWTARKFYTIDILEQETHEIENQFLKILSKEEIKNGAAIQYAEAIYASRLKKDATLNALPKAWNKIISEPDELLLELLSEVTEKICGFKPKSDIVRKFISSNQSRFITPDPTTIKSKSTIVPLKKENFLPQRQYPTSQSINGRFLELPELIALRSRIVSVKPMRMRINQDEFEVKNWAQADEVFVTWLISNGILKRTDLPIYSGKNKYYINSTDQHSRPDLDGSWKQIDDNFWVDVKYNVPRHLTNMDQAIEQLNAKSMVKVSIMITGQ